MTTSESEVPLNQSPSSLCKVEKTAGTATTTATTWIGGGCGLTKENVGSQNNNKNNWGYKTTKILIWDMPITESVDQKVGPNKLKIEHTKLKRLITEL